MPYAYTKEFYFFGFLSFLLSFLLCMHEALCNGHRAAMIGSLDGRPDRVKRHFLFFSPLHGRQTTALGYLAFLNGPHLPRFSGLKPHYWLPVLWDPSEDKRGTWTSRHATLLFRVHGVAAGLDGGPSRKRPSWEARSRLPQHLR